MNQNEKINSQTFACIWYSYLTEHLSEMDNSLQTAYSFSSATRFTERLTEVSLKAQKYLVSEKLHHHVFPNLIRLRTQTPNTGIYFTSTRSTGQLPGAQLSEDGQSWTEMPEEIRCLADVSSCWQVHPDKVHVYRKWQQRKFCRPALRLCDTGQVALKMSQSLPMTSIPLVLPGFTPLVTASVGGMAFKTALRKNMNEWMIQKDNQVQFLK